MTSHDCRFSHPSKVLLCLAPMLAMVLASGGYGRSAEASAKGPAEVVGVTVAPEGGIEAPSLPRRQRAILDAIRMVECGGLEVAPDGDGGAAIGPYQIHRCYWLDAVQFAPELGGCYEDCRDRAYAERVVDAYMTRYARDAWQSGRAETIARIHNGGPRGDTRQATFGYWQRVQRHLD